MRDRQTKTGGQVQRLMRPNKRIHRSFDRCSSSPARTRRALADSQTNFPAAEQSSPQAKHRVGPQPGVLRLSTLGILLSS